MDDWIDIAAIAIVVAALLLAFLRRRDVALPWWIDWLGASADVVITAIVSLKAGQWIGEKFGAGGDVDEQLDQADLAETHPGEAPTKDPLPLPAAQPPTDDVGAIHQELQDEIDETEHQTAAELEAKLKALARD